MKNFQRTASVLALAGLISTSALASDFQGAAKDAWITGKIETVYTLNSHLNPFSISTRVDNGVAHLTGTVDSEIDRELAGELALGIEGVVEVRNDLVVNAEASAEAKNQRDDNGRNFGSWVDDATTTAAVKSRLIRNAHTKGLQIDVDTRDDIVTLSGRVETDEEKELAGQIALNSSDVAEVRNNLVVDPQ
ncbi:MAG: BON domain-containing protein [Gammaproteobacteria bacterium]|nr:BON domain-containing protein [Gammaproteobacteria bacterium]